MKTLEDLFSEKEIAERLDFSRNWLRRKRLKGQGPPHVWLGNRVMYRGQDVDKWLDSLVTQEQSNEQ